MECSNRKSISWKIYAALFTLFLLSACRVINAAPGDVRTIDDSGAQTYNLSISQVKEAAQAGDPDAQYALGYSYYYGKGVPQDIETATFWIRKAAVQGQRQATKALVLMGKSSSIYKTNGDVAQPNPVVNNPSTRKDCVDCRPPCSYVTPANRTSAGHLTANPGEVMKPLKGPTPPSEPVPEVSQTPVADIKTTSTSVAQSERTTAASTPAPQAMKPVPPVAQAAPSATPPAMNNAMAQAQPQSQQSQPQPVVSAAKPQAMSEAAPASMPAAATAPAPMQSVAAEPNPMPVTASSTSFSSQDLTQAPSNYYTIQLLAASQESAMSHYIQGHHLKGKAVYYHTSRNGKDWYVLVYGLYKTRKEAEHAIQQLPSSLRELKPWVNSMTSVQGSMDSKSA